ncbi:ribonuclease H-like domain-containing protein [Tanacetum coccineum]
MVGSEDEIPPPPSPPSQTPTQQTPHTVSTIKLPFLKKGEYDIWAMKMEHYLAHTDYPIWEVIQRGNGPVSVSTDTNGLIKVLPPKTAEEILARERERKARTTLLMALPKNWGNDESKKMQKYILKQQFEGFSVSNSEGLHKGYDRFQSLLSQLEIHGAGVSTEDANQKFLRSLPSTWSQVSLIMRTKPGVDSLSFDDLYNNLRVFESDVKGSTASSSSTQNVAFVSENTSSTNDVSTAYGVSNSSGHNSQYEHTSSYSLLANQSSCPQLDHEDLEQLDEFDLEEMDLKWQVAMISMRMKKFYKKTGRKLQFDAKEPVGFDKTKVECYSCHKTRHFARECRSKGNQDSRRRDAWNTGNKDKDNGRRSGKQEDSKALVTLDGEGVDWTSHSEDEQENYALMACSSSGSDTEVTSCSKECKESYVKLKKLKDEGYEIDLDDKTDVLTYHKKLLAEAEKEKEDLKAKVEKWHNSSKNLNILQNSQMSARDKDGLGYGDQLNKGVLSYENEVFQSVFVSRTSETKNSPVNDRYAEGMHVVPPSMTGIYIPSGLDKEIDDSQFTYGPKQSKPSESDTTECDINTASTTNAARKVNTVKPIMNNARPKAGFNKTLSPFRKPFNRTTTIRTNFSYQKVNTAEVNAVSAIGGKRETAIRPSAEFKNKDFIEFCGSKGIKREYSNARTPQQNGVAERKNMTLIEAARTMLEDSFLPNTFWAEVVSTACYVLNRVLVTKPQNKTPYELITGKIPIISYIRPFGCPRVNLEIPLPRRGQVDGKPDEGFLVGYSLQSKAFRVYNLETKRVEENLHITFLENKLNVAGKGPTWLFNLDYLTDSMNYQHMRSENQANKHAGPKEANHNVGTKANIDAGNSKIEDESTQDYFVLPIWSSYTSTVKSSKAKNAGKEPNKNSDLKTDENLVDKEEQVFLDELEWLKRQEQDANDVAEALKKEFAKDTEDLLLQAGAAKASITNTVNTASTPVSTDKPEVSTLIRGYNIY